MTETLAPVAKIAQDLIRIDTQNFGEGRSNGEAEAANYVSDYLARLGIDSTTYESAPDRTSVVAHIAGADESLPKLVVHGHLDVVPADPANWSVDPFGGVVQDGLLWGRGAVDMKNMVAMMLQSVADIVTAGKRPHRSLVLVFFADEENGGDYGSHFMVREHPEVFAGATEAISEVGGYSVTIAGTRAYLLQTAEKAMLWVKLRARGTAAHGSQVMSDNAVTRLARAVHAIGTHEFAVQLTDTTRALTAAIADLLQVDLDELGPDEVARRTGSISRFLRASLRNTANPTMLDAGYKHNVIPDTAEARIDLRPLPGHEDELLAQLQQIVGDDIEIDVMHRDVGLDNPFEGALVDTMVRSIQRHDPDAPVMPYMLSGGTDNKALSLLGITGYGFAPLQLPEDLDFAAMFHGVDERVPLASLDFGTKVLTDLLLEY